MKIIHLISGGDVGGAKTHVLSLLHGLSATEQARLVCFKEGDFAAEARQLGIDTVVMECPLKQAVKTLEKTINAEGFEIVHCHGARANLVGVLMKKHISAPVITTVHSDYRIDYMGRPLGRLTYGTINTVALRKIDDYVCVSDQMGDLLIERGFDPQHIYSICNGVDFTPRPLNMTREQYFASVGLSAQEDTVVFGIAARLSAVKDIATLIRAFGAAQKEQENIRLLIAGDGELREELESLAKQCCAPGTCVFAGWVSDMDSFYNAIDVNTLTSLSEGFPYALPEGARMHCATIASRVGGVPKFILHRKTGLLFEPKDAETLKAHILLFAKDKDFRLKMAQALYEKAEKEYSVEATVRMQKEIYASVLRRRARRAEKKRDGVVICGAYGRDNAGDEAILDTIVKQMRDIDTDMPLWVLTRKPRPTAARYRIGAVHTFRYLQYCRVLNKTELYLNGGGSLIQDVTSSRSLAYYLSSIAAASRHGNKVLMYGCGIGPVRKNANRVRAGKVIDRCADCITLREACSLEELRSMGVSRPEMKVTADPAMLLGSAEKADVEDFLLEQGVPLEKGIALFALRPWKHGADKQAQFVQAAEYLRENCDLYPVFLAMEPKTDLPVCRDAAEKLGTMALAAPEDSELLVGLMGYAKIVIAMRLHALIFSSGVGTPIVGVSYDPKVRAFMQYLENPACLDLDAFTAEELIDHASRELSKSSAYRQTAEKLRALAEENKLAAKRLLEEVR